MGLCIELIRPNTFGGVDISEIRLFNTRKAAAAVGGPAEFGRRTDRGDSQVSQIIGKNPTRKIGSGLARKIEKKLDLEPGSLDIPPPKYSALVEEAAAELAIRDDDAQVYVLQIIRKIPPREIVSLAASMPDVPPKPSEPPKKTRRKRR